MKNTAVNVVATVVVTLASSLAVVAGQQQQPKPGEEPGLTAVRSGLMWAEYGQAVAEADRYLRNQGDDADEVMYLKALALYRQDKAVECEQTARQFVERYPDSEWYRKGRFLLARVLTDQRKYEEGERIYEEEANRLLSADRKREIAQVLIRFAEDLSHEPGPDELDAPPPDYRKAASLYMQVLEMEIPRETRDLALYTTAVLLGRTGSHAEAATRFRSYLDEFDPTWTGPVGSVQRMRGQLKENPGPAGQHVVPARYELAVAQLKSGDFKSARMNFESLSTLLQLMVPAKDARARAVKDAAGANLNISAYAADCGWRLIQTYQLPKSREGDAELGIRAAQEFLREYPEHPQAVVAAWLIAQTYQNMGQHDKAIEAYSRFMDGDSYRLPGGEAALKTIEGWDRTPAELAQEWQQRALYLTGQLRYEQQRFADAIEQWKKYVNRYPNGPDWAQAQRQIIDATYMIALTAVSDRKYDDARRLFAEYMAAYPLDGRVPQAMFTFGQISKAEGDAAEEREKGSGGDSYRTAISEWARLIGKYPDRDESSLALWRTGLLYEEKLGQLADAVESYRRLTWGPWADDAQQRLRLLTEQQMHVETERTFRLDEPAVVAVHVRNIKELTVRQYRFDPEAYFRETHRMGDVDGLDIALIEPDDEWNVPIDGYEKYRPIDQSVEMRVRDGRPGVWLVNVTGDDEFEATTLVIRSDLDLVTQSTESDVLVYVQDMRRTRPADNVQVLLSNGSEIVNEGTTGADGVVLLAFDSEQAVNGLRVFAMRDGHIASSELHVDRVGRHVAESPIGYIYTDQPMYRPGQMVHVRGIIRDVKEDGGPRYTPAGKAYTVSIQGPNSREIQRQDATLSEFGTFAIDVPLDPAAPIGGYTVTVQPADQPERVVFNGYFRVEQYALQKMKLEINCERLVYRPGETITGTIRASYFWGGAVANQAVSYILPGGQQYTEHTNAKGEIPIEFDTAGFESGRALSVHAFIQGEDVNVTAYLYLEEREFNLSVSTVQDVALSGEPFDVKVKATTPAEDKPAGCEVTLRVLRRVETPVEPVLHALPWVDWPTPEVTEEVATYHGTIAAETGATVIQVTLDDAGWYQLQAEAVDRNGTPVSGSESCYVSGDDDEEKLRLFAKSDTLKVGEQVDIRLHSRVEGSALALITLVGDRVLEHRVAPLRAGDNTVSIDVSGRLAPNFTLCVAVMSGRDLHWTSHEFDVERELQVTVTPAGGVVKPGDRGMVDLLVTDQAGRPVEAELSLAVVDEALLARNPVAEGPIVSVFNEGATRSGMADIGASNGFAYQAETRKVIKALVEEQERLARRAAEGEQMAQTRQELFEDQVALRSQNTLELVEKSPQGDVPGAAAYGRQGIFSTQGAETGGMAGKRMGRFGEGGDADSALWWYYGARASDEVGDFGAAPGQAGAMAAFYAAVRREIESGGWWAPAIVTDATGTARVEVAWPERTSEWHVSVKGVDRGMLVGEATGSVITRKDLFVEIKAPLVAAEGDSVQVLARVHNPGGYSGPAVARLVVSSGNDAQGQVNALVQQEQRIEIPEAGEGEPVEVLFGGFTLPAVGTSGRVQLTVSVVADEAGGPSDALTRWVLVEPWGMDYAVTCGGTAEGDVSVGVQLPSKPKYQSVWMNVMVGPTLEQSIIDLALRAWPVALHEGRGGLIPTHPGVELLASISGLEYAKKVGSSETDRVLLVSRSRALVGSLVVQQEGDGGWSAAPGSGSDWTTSAISYWALARAQANGIAVDESVLARAEQWLRNQYSSLPASDFTVRPVMLHALSVRKKADFEWANTMYRQRNAMDSPALTYTALALANLDRLELAREILTVLEARAKRERTRDEAGDAKWLCSWTADTQGRLPNWYDQDVVVTAISLMAYSRVNPGSERAAEAAAYLMDQAGLSGCRPVWGRGFVVAALGAHYGTGQPSVADYQIDVTVNGQAVGTINNRRGVRENQTRASLSIIEVPSEILRADGGNVVQFAYHGRGKYTYAVRMTGFSPAFHDSEIASDTLPEIRSRKYLHAPLDYRGVPLSVASQSPVENIEIGQRVRVQVDLRQRGYGGHLVIEEPLPAGLSLVPNSPSGNFSSHEVRNGRLILRYRPGLAGHAYSYELTGNATGQYHVAPTVIRDAFRDDVYRMGTEAKLTVLAPDEKSTDEYQMSVAERLELGKAYFKDGLYREAETYLWPLFDMEKKLAEVEVAQMLLWIHTTEAMFDAARVVQAFEILSVRHPSLTIPFDKVLAVGRAYREIGEYEMGWRVFRATIDSSFLTDSWIGAVLQDEGQLLGSVAYQLGLWDQYPDTSAVVGSYFALSQTLYGNAAKAHLLSESRSRLDSRALPVIRNGSPHEEGGDDKPTQAWMLGQTIRLLGSFLVNYSDDPLADDAAFSMSNAFLDLKDYARVVSLSESFGKRFPESEYVSSFQYLTALGHFWQRAYNPALAAATAVADGNSKDRDFARYIVGQIHHARGKPADAIAWYEKVKDQYSDANEAIAYFERQALSVDEITTVKPGEQVSLKVKHRNVASIHIQAYKVDLMKLYLREKSLSNMTQVHLAGIEPTLVKEIPLKDAARYENHELSVDLDIKDEGAYLVICRAENLYASGLALVTPLSIEVQEEAESGRVRVNLIDDVKEERPAGVHVKAVGSGGDGEIRSGETDLRGVFVADGLVGEVTVIARDADARYAFYRGEQWIGPQAGARRGGRGRDAGEIQGGQSVVDYTENIRSMNDSVQSSNQAQWDKARRRGRKGVDFKQVQ